MDNLNIKLTNHLTGEITEVEVRSAEEAKNLLLQLNASALLIKKASDRLKNYLVEFLGNDEEYQFADGKRMTMKQRATYIYQVTSLKNIGLDEDQIALITQVNKTAADSLVKEMIERNELPGNSLRILQEEAEMKASKPFLELR